MPNYLGIATDELTSNQINQSRNAGVGNNSLLMSWALILNFVGINITKDVNEATTRADIIWPDGTPGVFTADILSTAFPGAVDAWHATYLGNPVKTITQAAYTRNANGSVIAQSIPVIS